MKEFPKERYKIVIHGNEVIAISSYAGRTVKGIAKTDPRDEFDPTIGEELATARCNLKVAERRLARAQSKISNLYEEENTLRDKIFDAEDYYKNAYDALESAKEEMNMIEERLRG